MWPRLDIEVNMETAIWKGKFHTATEIANSYELEKTNGEIQWKTFLEKDIIFIKLSSVKN